MQHDILRHRINNELLKATDNRISDLSISLMEKNSFSDSTGQIGSPQKQSLLEISVMGQAPSFFVKQLAQGALLRIRDKNALSLDSSCNIKFEINMDGLNAEYPPKS